MGTLLKYEFKDSKKAYMKPVILILMSLLISFFSYRVSEQDSAILQFLGSVSNFLILGFVVATVILRFTADLYVLYHSLYGENSYRTFLLPYSGWQIIFVKTLVSLVWAVIISLLAGLSIFLFFTVITEVSWGTILSQYKEGLLDFMKMVYWPNILIVGVDHLARVIIGTLSILLAGSIAHSSYFHGRRGVKTFLFVVFISFVYGRISGLLGAGTLTVMSRYPAEEVILGTSRLASTQLFWVMMYNILFAAFMAYGIVWFWDNKLEII